MRLLEYRRSVRKEACLSEAVLSAPNLFYSQNNAGSPESGAESASIIHAGQLILKKSALTSLVLIYLTVRTGMNGA